MATVWSYRCENIAGPIFFFFSYSNPFLQYTNNGYMLSKSKGTFTVTGSTYSPFHQGLKENMDVNGGSCIPSRSDHTDFFAQEVSLWIIFWHFYVCSRPLLLSLLRGSSRFKGLIINSYALRLCYAIIWRIFQYLYSYIKKYWLLDK